MALDHRSQKYSIDPLTLNIVLVYLFVHPEHRRRGIGRQLVNWGKSPNPAFSTLPDG